MHKTLFELEKDIKAKTQEVEELQKQIKEMNSLTPTQLLADTLHKLQCRYNHTDGCSYYYSDWDKPCDTRKRWIERANKLEKIGKKWDITAEAMLDIIHILKV